MPHFQPSKPLRENLRAEWMLEPDVAFLNHGSFGATPRAVFDAQTDWRKRLEAAPVELLGRRLFDLVERVKTRLGAWLGMKPTDFGFVTNASDAVNAVLRSLRFSPGDEIVTTDHAYNAVWQTMRFVAEQSGATCRRIAVPLPIHNARQITDAVLNGLASKTKLLILDHITSPTAVMFPVEQICAECRARGIEVLVDGAHAPGMLDLNVESIGATYYAGNLHKWACGPRGVGYLWVSLARQKDIHPTVISHHLEEGFSREFDWQGTRDFSGWLAMESAMDFMEQLGWEKIRGHNHAMAAWAQEMLCERFGTTPITPPDGSLLGSMAAVPLPGALSAMSEPQRIMLQQRLYSDHRVEAPISVWPSPRLIRVSCQVYNTPEEYERLVEAVFKLREG